jgi:hypothetical protein
MLPALERTRLEKLGADQGFDLTPVVQGDWLLLRSTQFQEPAWVTCGEKEGTYRLAIAGTRLGTELRREGVSAEVFSDLPGGVVGAFSLAGYGALYQMLGRVSALARSLPTCVAERFAAAANAMPTSTEAERLVVQRVGQQLFRDALIDYWRGQCAVTGLNLVSLLRASHIKPWSRCDSDGERLDVYNGLLLAPQLDALFDGGWITFDHGGTMIVSDLLTLAVRSKLGVPERANLSWITDEHEHYLAFHRAQVFRTQ